MGGIDAYALHIRIIHIVKEMNVSRIWFLPGPLHLGVKVRQKWKTRWNWAASQETLVYSAVSDLQLLTLPGRFNLSGSDDSSERTSSSSLVSVAEERERDIPCSKSSTNSTCEPQNHEAQCLS